MGLFEALAFFFSSRRAHARSACANCVRGQKCTSREKRFDRGERAFVHSLQLPDASRENAHRYDGCVAGRSVYSYVRGNPINLIDPLGLAPGFNTSQCVQNYLNEYYGSFVATTLVPNFSALSYVPGSGTTSQAWTSATVSLVTKGALVGAPYVAGQALNLTAIATASAAQIAMQSLAAAATPGNALITASKVASGAFGLFAAATVPFATAANIMALESCSCNR